jgi:hypothetical protein
MAAPHAEDARSEEEPPGVRVIVEGVEQEHDSGIFNKLVSKTGRHGWVQNPKASEESPHAPPPPPPHHHHHQPQAMAASQEEMAALQEEMAALQEEGPRSEYPPGVRVIVEGVEQGHDS